jgi:hypothetical protein
LPKTKLDQIEDDRDRLEMANTHVKLCNELRTTALQAIGGLAVLAGAHAELAWAPGAISRSPLYPFWLVRARDRTVIVDQRGVVWPDLPPTSRGGRRTAGGRY